MKPQFTITQDLYATQGQRIANFLIDIVARLILMFVFGIVLALIGGLTDNPSFISFFENMDRITEILVEAVFIFIYYSIFEIATGRTLGKYITKTIVVDEYGDEAFSADIFKRSLCRLIPFDAFSFLGASGRGWHDSLSNTYVVKKDELERKKQLFTSFEEIGKEQE